LFLNVYILEKVCYKINIMKIGITIPIYHSNDILADFTKQTIESVSSKNCDVIIFLIVNYSTKEFYPKKENYKLHKCIKDFQVIDNPKGNHVPASWNRGVETALSNKCDYVIIANNDLVFHHAAIDNLIKFANEHKEFIMWTASEWIDIRTIGGIKEAHLVDSFDEHPHFSCFMINKKAVEVLKEKEKNTKEPYPGFFDENFDPAYFEDQDMAHRIYNAGFKAGKTNTSKFYHYGSRTIKVDENIGKKNIRSYEAGRTYFKRKWGYDAHTYCPQTEKDRLKNSYKMPFNK